MTLNQRPQSSHLALRKHLDLLLSSSITAKRTSVTDREAVPSGIVAACVQRLQSQAQSQSPASAEVNSASVDHRKGSSRTGFGRRLTNRFGQPAIQNTKPNEEPTTPDNSHTFAGLTTHRKNHHEEHAIADAGLKSRRRTHNWSSLDRSKQGATPENILSKRSLSRSILKRRTSIDSDVLGEVDATGKQSHFIAQTSIFPIASNSEDDSDTHGHRLESNSKDTLNSEKSFATTSTIRRQGVRDLFIEYGVEKPSGLASKSPSRERESTYHNGKKICHLCSWYNNKDAGNCWRCGHKLCSICGEDVADHLENLSRKTFEATKPDLSPKDSKVIEEEPVKNTHARPLPILLHPKLASFDSSRKPSSVLSKFPDYYEPLISRALSLATPEPQKPLLDQPSLTFLSGSRTTTHVKNSPFLIADLQFPRKSGGTTTRKPEPRTQAPQIHSAQNVPRVNRSQSSSDCSSEPATEVVDCGVPLCRQTPRLAYRVELNGTSRPGKMHKEHVHEATDHGYAADTSFVEDGLRAESSATEGTPRSDLRHQHTANASQGTENSQIECSHGQQLRRYSRSQYYSARPESHLTFTTLSKKQSASINDRLSIEFVECHGYPRTGHAPQSNSKNLGLVGECQHSFDDCQCAACQNTHHNVRCCTHPDHQAIIHHHHNPRKEFSVPYLVDLFSNPTPRALTDVRPLSPPMSRTANGKSIVLTSEDSSISQRSSTYGIGPQNVMKKAAIPKAPPLPPSKISVSVQQGRNQIGLTQSKLVLSEVTSDSGAIDSGLHVGKSKPAESVMSLQTTKREASDDVSEYLEAQLAHAGLDPRETVSGEQNTGKPGTDGTSASFAEPLQNSTFPSRKTSDVTKELWKPPNLPHIMHSVPKPRRTSLVMPSIFFDPVDADTVLLRSQNTWESRDIFTTQRKEVSASFDSMNEGGIPSPKALGTIKPVQKSSRHISSDSAAERNLRLKLAERKPTRSGGSDAMIGRKAVQPNQEHSLSDDADDATLVEEGTEHVLVLPDKTDNHECIWKNRFVDTLVDQQRRNHHGSDDSMDFNIKGITIIIHLHGREDLVVKAESWDGGDLRMNV